MDIFYLAALLRCAVYARLDRQVYAWLENHFILSFFFFLNSVHTLYFSFRASVGIWVCNPAVEQKVGHYSLVKE